MMKVHCPHCGTEIAVKGISGRKSPGYSVEFITDVLQGHFCSLRRLHSGKVKHKAVLQTAEELHCSKGFVYAAIKQAGKTVDEVLEGVK